MVLTEEQRKEFEVLSKPLMKFLCENFHPHVTVVIEPTRAEILSGSAAFNCDDFILD